MTRPAHITIHLDALVSNIQLARNQHGGRIIAVVKANAYGHGDVQVAKALMPHCDGFAVACVEEAFALRAAHIDKPIVLLEGPFSSEEIELYQKLQLTPVIHHEDQLRWWQEQAPLSGIWLKVDSGMHRLGFSPDQSKKILSQIGVGKGQVEVLMTHFANADNLDPKGVTLPLQRFNEAKGQALVATSLANSAAIMLHPPLHGDWARPGLMLYGVDPLGRPPKTVGLKPAMTLSSRVIDIHWIEPHESVGYGSLFTARRKTLVATIACGYADGYPRTAKNGTPVWIKGHIVPLIGRVSMDMITVDITDHPEITVGEAVQLWGDRVGVAEVAEAAGTLAYELLCHTQRPQRSYRSMTEK